MKRLTHGTRVNLQAFSVGETTINDMWMVVDGARVNNGGEVAPGKEFVVVVSFNAKNAVGGLITAWSVCLTVSDSTGLVKNYRIKDSSFALPGEIASSSLELDRMGKNIMPDVAQLDLKIRVWGSDQLRPEKDYPDSSLWW
jgi:hypothetical protein